MTIARVRPTAAVMASGTHLDITAANRSNRLSGAVAVIALLQDQAFKTGEHYTLAMLRARIGRVDETPRGVVRLKSIDNFSHRM
jgi:hypothetical protein